MSSFFCLVLDHVDDGLRKKRANSSADNGGLTENSHILLTCLAREGASGSIKMTTPTIGLCKGCHQWAVFTITTYFASVDDHSGIQNSRVAVF